jgi:hypothetical protein
MIYRFMTGKRTAKISASGIPPGQRKEAEKVTLRGMPSKERRRHKTTSATSTPLSKVASSTAKRSPAASKSRAAKSKISDAGQLTPEQLKEREEADREWDRLLATPESDMFLAILAIQAEEDRKNGNIIEGGWDEI